jgi:RNA polymerase sigma-70 factor (ECF subfamily)
MPVDAHQIQMAVQQLRRGKIEGLSVIVQAYQVPALRTAYLILGEVAAAEDVVQTVFVRIFERIEQYDPARPFAPWLLRCVANEALTIARRQQRLVSLDAPLHDQEDDVSFLDMLPDEALTPDRHLEQQELRETVWQALQTLNPDQRTTLVLRYYVGLSEEELATQTNAPLGTVKWRLHSARRQLRALLGQFWQTDVWQAKEA